jgi:hypothetical protein
VATEEYWVEVSQEGRWLGAGFLLTRCHALTALHCLRDADPTLDELDIKFAEGSTVPGRVYRRAPEADLALIDIEMPKSVECPVLLQHDHASVNESWLNPYRPTLSHAFLSGNVTKGPAMFECVGGGMIEAIQLLCSQSVGDYAGYSGSPIERSDPHHRRRTLLGILLEQYPEQGGNYGEHQRASAVLFAATISEVFRRFDCFGADHMIMEVAPRPDTALAGPLPSHDRDHGARSANEQVTRATSLIRALDEMERSKALEGIDVNVLKLDVLNKLISNIMGSGAECSET